MFIYNLNWNEHVTPYLIKLHYLPINYRILLKLFIIGYKVVNNTALIYLSNSFNLYQPTTTQNLRIGSGRDMLMLVYKNSVHNQLNNNLSKLTQTWNSLAYEIRSISAYAVFKKNLKIYYFREAYIVNDICFSEIIYFEIFFVRDLIYLLNFLLLSNCISLQPVSFCFIDPDYLLFFVLLLPVTYFFVSV